MSQENIDKAKEIFSRLSDRSGLAGQFLPAPELLDVDYVLKAEGAFPAPLHLTLTEDVLGFFMEQRDWRFEFLARGLSQTFEPSTLSFLTGRSRVKETLNPGGTLRAAKLQTPSGKNGKWKTDAAHYAGPFAVLPVFGKMQKVIIQRSDRTP